MQSQLLNDPLRPHPLHTMEFPIHDAMPGAGVEKAWMTFTRSELAFHDLLAYDLLIPLSGAMARCYLRRNAPNQGYPLVGKEGFKYDTEKIVYALKDVDDNQHPRKPAWMTWQMIYTVTYHLLRYTHDYAALDTVIELIQADKSVEKGQTVMARGFLKNIPVK